MSTKICSLCLLTFFLFSAVAFATPQTDGQLEKCIEKTLKEKTGCLPMDKMMQAFRLLFKAIEVDDGSLLCKGYRELKLDSSLIWEMSRVVYADGVLRAPWIRTMPQPTDPALLYIAYIAKSKNGKHAAMCGNVYVDLYSHGDGYFREYLGEYLGKFLLDVERRKREFDLLKGLTQNMKQDLIHFTPIEDVQALVVEYENLEDSPFKAAMLPMIRESLKEAEMLYGTTPR